MSMKDSMSAHFRPLPALTGHAFELDIAALPSDPVEFFTDWIERAVAAGVAEPHAMTLSTVDESGIPDARVLVLKDLDARGWAFGSTKSSTKG